MAMGLLFFTIFPLRITRTILLSVTSVINRNKPQVMSMFCIAINAVTIFATIVVQNDIKLNDYMEK
jgi:hypothetical protein